MTELDHDVQASADGQLRPSPMPEGGPPPASQKTLGTRQIGAEIPAGAEPTVRRFVYALGRIEPRFPTLAAEKEFAQVAGRADMVGLTDRQAIHEVLSQPQNRYLVREMCWVFTVEGLETYILQPRDLHDLELLVDSLRPAPRATDIDIVIGTLGPIAPPGLCNSLMVPVVVFDQIYSFDIDSLIKSIPRPSGVPAKEFTAVADEVFSRVVQLADNAGATDEHRALNYLAVRYPAIYHMAADRLAVNTALSSVEVQPSRLSNTRQIVDVILSYTNRQTDVAEKWRPVPGVHEYRRIPGRNTSAYYDLLSQVGRGTWQPENDSRPWVRFTLVAHLRQARTMLRRVRESERLRPDQDHRIGARADGRPPEKDCRPGQ